MTSKNNKTPVLYYIKLCASFQIHWWIKNWSYSPEMLNWGKNWRFCVPHDLAIWWMTLKNNRAPLLYYMKLCATFQSHWHIQTGITVRKRSIRVKISWTGWLKIDVWPWKTIGHLFYTTSSLCIISNPLAKSNLSYSLETLKLGKNWRFFFPCDLKNWCMTLKNNRAPLLCCFNLCASFHSQWWIQTGVTVWKRPIWVKIDNFFFSRATLKFDGWP